MYSFLIISCGDSQVFNEGLDSQEEQLDFSLISETEFNPYINHGQIEKIRMIVSGMDYSDPIIKTFPYGTSKGTLPPIKIGQKIQVEVQGLNANGIIVRKGLSDIFEVDEKYPQKIKLSYIDIPIFTNIFNGATVYQSRFVPKIFAKSNLEFQLTDSFSGSLSPLLDMISGSELISLNQIDHINYNRTVPIAPLEAGEHIVKVGNPFSGGTSEVSIQIIQDHAKHYLVTSSGYGLGTWGVNYNPTQSFQKEARGD